MLSILRILLSFTIVDHLQSSLQPLQGVSTNADEFSFFPVFGRFCSFCLCLAYVVVILVVPAVMEVARILEFEMKKYMIICTFSFLQRHCERMSCKQYKIITYLQLQISLNDLDDIMQKSAIISGLQFGTIFLHFT